MLKALSAMLRLWLTSQFPDLDEGVIGLVEIAFVLLLSRTAKQLKGTLPRFSWRLPSRRQVIQEAAPTALPASPPDEPEKGKSGKKHSRKKKGRKDKKKAKKQR